MRPMLLLAITALATSVAGFSYHDNYLTISFDGAPSNVQLLGASYTIDAHSITSGQDPKSHIVDGTSRAFQGSGGSFVFSVGRKGSSGVANWWSSRIAPSQNTFGHNPGDLNFAFSGTLQLDTTAGTLFIPDVHLAQGKALASNNWWFGGKTCGANGASNQVVCTALDGRGLTFVRGGNDVSEVHIIF